MGSTRRAAVRRAGRDTAHTPVVDSPAVNEHAPPPTASPGTPRTRGRGLGRWPFGLLAVVVLRLLNAIGLLLYGLDIGTVSLAGLPLIGNNTMLTRAIDIGLAVLVLIGIIGLLRFRRWGWVLTMVLVGISLAGDLIRTWIGEPVYLGLLLHVLAAFYLNGRSVRALAGEDLDDDPRLHP